MRQLTFRAEYDVKCSSITHPGFRSTISAQYKHHFQQILEVCGSDHRDEDKGQPFIPLPQSDCSKQNSLFVSVLSPEY